LVLRRKRNIYSARAAKPIAQRTCVACRRISDKRTLMRLVRTSEGSIEIDRRGKREGRGAYLCPSQECWEAALKGKALEHALHASFTRENREQLLQCGRDLLKELNSGKG